MLDDKDLEEIEKRIVSHVGYLGYLLTFMFCVLLFQGCFHRCQALPIREALSQIESGGNDKAVGRAKEVSRFQILPSVWREYSSLPNYRDENHAWAVSEKILADRRETFRQATGRQPNHKETYALWHRPGLFERVRYNWRRLPGRVRERAQRFENLRLTP